MAVATAMPANGNCLAGGPPVRPARPSSSRRRPHYAVFAYYGTTDAARLAIRVDLTVGRRQATPSVFVLLSLPSEDRRRPLFSCFSLPSEDRRRPLFSCFSRSPPRSLAPTVTHAVGIDADAEGAAVLIKELEGKDVEEVIAAGREKLQSVGGGVAVAGGAGGAAAAGGAAPAAEEEDEDMGFSLFD